jgi:hypothetical protein
MLTNMTGMKSNFCVGCVCEPDVHFQTELILFAPCGGIGAVKTVLNKEH